MRTRTAEQLVGDVRLRANLENSQFVSDAEIIEYLNQELAEIWARIVANEGQPHFRNHNPITVTNGITLYALPADFYEIQEMVATIGGIARSLQPFMTNERARLLNAQLYAYTASPRYRVQGTMLELLPATQSFTLDMYYVPTCPRLVLSQTPQATFDGFNGYELAAIYGATAICNNKEQIDPSFNLAQKERILRLMELQASKRDNSNPERVTDVVGLDSVQPAFPWE